MACWLASNLTPRRQRSFGGRYKFWACQMEEVLYVGGGEDLDDSVYDDVWRSEDWGRTWEKIGKVGEATTRSEATASSWEYFTFILSTLPLQHIYYLLVARRRYERARIRKGGSLVQAPALWAGWCSFSEAACGVGAALPSPKLIFTTATGARKTRECLGPR